jgi:hypothetical protein
VFYAVYNSKGAVVGVIVSDGIQVNFGTPAVDSVTICFKYDPDLFSSDYTVLDMAERYEFNYRGLTLCFLSFYLP